MRKNLCPQKNNRNETWDECLKIKRKVKDMEAEKGLTFRYQTVDTRDQISDYLFIR